MYGRGREGEEAPENRTPPDLGPVRELEVHWIQEGVERLRSSLNPVRGVRGRTEVPERLPNVARSVPGLGPWIWFGSAQRRPRGFRTIPGGFQEAQSHAPD